jgi:hypothetical protein
VSYAPLRAWGGDGAGDEGLRTMRRRAAVGGLLFVTWLGIAPSSEALAQPANGAADVESAQTDQARQLYKDGLKEAARGKWEKARELFAEAFRLKPHVQIALNLGQAEFKVGKHRDAAEHLSYFLREATEIEPGDRKKTEELLEQAKARVGTLRITARPDGAEIRIDGVSVTPAALKGEVFVEPGVHLVEARRAQYEPTQVTRDVGAGWREQIELRLTKVEPQKVELPLVVPPPSAQEGGPNKTVVVVGGVVAGLAAAAGIGLTVGAKVKLDERLEAEQSCKGQRECPKYDAAESVRFNFAIAAITSYIAAGVLGAGTLTYVLASPSAKSKSTARADLLLGPGTAGATVTLTW